MKKILRNMFVGPPLYALALVIGYLATSDNTSVEKVCSQHSCYTKAGALCIVGAVTYVDYCYSESTGCTS